MGAGATYQVGRMQIKTYKKKRKDRETQNGQAYRSSCGLFSAGKIKNARLPKIGGSEPDAGGKRGTSRLVDLCARRGRLGSEPQKNIQGVQH